MSELAPRASVVIAALLSVGVHVGTGVVVLRYADGVTAGALTGSPDAPAQTWLTLASPGTPPPIPDPPKPEATPASARPPEPPPEPPPPPRREVTAGVDESKALTETWKGVREAEATEHAAAKFEIDQAGFTPEAGPPIPPGKAAPAAGVSPEAESPEAPRATPQPENVVPTPATPESPSPSASAAMSDRTMEARDEVEARVPTPPTEPPRPDATLPVPVEAPAQAGQAAQDRAEASTLPVAAEARAALPIPAASSPAAPAGGTIALAGIIAPDESAARSANEPIAVKPGKPIARQGLRIQTSHARFSVSALILNKPRSPLVRITFDRDGKVKHAMFVPGQTTGSDDVDKPLLDSLYRWSAHGKDLLTIPPHDPHAGLTLTFRIVL